MKKRILCFMLAALMVLAVSLTSCSSSDSDATSTTSSSSGGKAMTITLYSITDEKTTEEAIAQVEAEMNKITEGKLNTHVILKLFTPDEYDKAIENIFVAMEEQKLLNEAQAAAKKIAQRAAKEVGYSTTAATTSAEELATPDETVENEYGFNVTVYPEEKGTQFDIFLVQSEEDLQKFYEAELLTSLQSELTGTSKLVNDYINPIFLNHAKIDGKVYAIPNNHMIGEYEYLLLNKKLIDKYFFDPDTIQTIPQLKDFISTVAEKEPAYTPFVSTADAYVAYVTGTPSLLGAFINKSAADTTLCTPKNLLGVTSYVQTLSALEDYKDKGYIYSEPQKGKEFAAAIVNGNIATPAIYEDDYYVSVYKYPRADAEDIFPAMYAISSFAADPSRCMQVLSLLTTNEEYRNVFQYGVEKVHYEIDEDTGIYNIISDDYIMDPSVTGNQFLLKQSDAMDEETLLLSENKWALGKQHNIEALVEPYFGFKITERTTPATTTTPAETTETTAAETTAAPTTSADGETTEAPAVTIEPPPIGKYTNEEILENISKISEEYYKKISEFEPYTTEEGVTVTLSDYISQLRGELDINEYFLAALNQADPFSIISQYLTWFEGKSAA